jgi:dTDP-4-dehydrorhamnose reductase
MEVARTLPALWGGIECTVNRVRDCFFDQLEFSGHTARPSDLERIAELGLSTLRYPLIWERAQPNLAFLPDFGWTDERLKILGDLRISPIAGLLHHGSGPLGTSLTDPLFPEKFASFARRVAERYPWLRRFTPINEPLTTARFSGLYGHWFPHETSDASFARTLLNQCRATVLAMAAIRKVIPNAELVQTEDMGVVRSTAELDYQAQFENERRFLSFDLLSGRVKREHPLYGYLRHAGASERELAFFVENPCPPDIFGINYYVTSERFLDGRIANYPPELVGGNRHHRYADVEAVRVCSNGLLGPASILRSTYARYERPVAVTEAHLGCSALEQARWLSYVYTEAATAHEGGAEIVSVTVWALLGAFGWSSLVTRGKCDYEPGVFSVASGTPEPTALAAWVKDFETSGASLDEDGWWTRAERLIYEPYVERSRAA